MWRKVRSKDDDDVLEQHSRRHSKSAGLGQHKPLMVNKPKLKRPKAKHQIEKKWKMTKSRFLEILQGEHTKRSLKSKRWILKTMNEILDNKYKSDKNCLRENRAILALPEFMYHEYIPSRFGIKNLVDAMCWDIHKAVEHYSDSSRSGRSGVDAEELKEIVTFKRFLEEDLSLDDLSFYLKARKVLTESKSLLLDGGLIPFECLNVLLDNVFDGTFKEQDRAARRRPDPLRVPQRFIGQRLRWNLQRAPPRDRPQAAGHGAAAQRRHRDPQRFVPRFHSEGEPAAFAPVPGLGAGAVFPFQSQQQSHRQEGGQHEGTAVHFEGTADQIDG